MKKLLPILLLTSSIAKSNLDTTLEALEKYVTTRGEGKTLAGTIAVLEESMGEMRAFEKVARQLQKKAADSLKDVLELSEQINEVISLISKFTGEEIKKLQNRPTRRLGYKRTLERIEQSLERLTKNTALDEGVDAIDNALQEIIIMRDELVTIARNAQNASTSIDQTIEAIQTMIKNLQDFMGEGAATGGDLGGGGAPANL